MDIHITIHTNCISLVEGNGSYIFLVFTYFNQSTFIKYSFTNIPTIWQIAEAPIIWPLMQSLEKTLMLVKIEGRRRRGQQRIRCLDGITDSLGISSSKFREMWGTGKPGCCSLWGHKESDMTEQLNNNTMPNTALANHEKIEKVLSLFKFIF